MNIHGRFNLAHCSQFTGLKLFSPLFFFSFRHAQSTSLDGRFGMAIALLHLITEWY